MGHIIGISPQDYLYLRSKQRSPIPEKPTTPAWWDIPGKLERGDEIAREEKGRFGKHHNDLEDGLRHAEWSRRMADELGPTFSTAVGIGHEVTGLIGGQQLPEAIMDIRNNAEGVADAQERRAVRSSRIQSSPRYHGVGAPQY